MRRFAPTLAALWFAGCFVSVGDVAPGGTDGSADGAGAGGSGGSGAAGGSGGSAPDAAEDGGAAGAGGAADASTPLFSDDFSGDLSAWSPAGTGDWKIVGGELHQGDPTADLALIYVPLVDAANYRVVARMRQVGAANQAGGAVEIAFRIDPTTPSLYHCNWEPNFGRIVIQYLDGANEDVILEKFAPLPAGYDPFATFTMELSIVAAQIQCRILEVPGSEIAAGASPLFPKGSVGLKTWMMAAAFDDFEVYAQ
jgi:hypothetical protein